MMIGIVLAAGSGARLQKDLNMEEIGPKCLMKINNHSLLERHIYDFKTAEFEKVLIVSGFREELLQKEAKKLKKKYAIDIEIVNNDRFSTTNTASSLLIALARIDNSDVIIINGDVIYDCSLFSDIVSKKKAAIVVDNVKELTGESFKIAIVRGTISSMGKDIPIESSDGEYIGLSKISSNMLPISRDLLSHLIRKDDMSYYDMIFQDLSTQIGIEFVFTNGKKWTEIDDICDYRYAKKISPDIDDTREMT